MKIDNIIEFFFEKHPYIKRNDVRFVEEGQNRVKAIIKNVGVSYATETEKGLVGFDVLYTNDNSPVLFNQKNTSDLFRSSDKFAVPAKAPEINPTLRIPSPVTRGVRIMLTKEAQWVVDIDRHGALYEVTIYDDKDQIVKHETMLNADQVKQLLEDYGFQIDDALLDSGGVISSIEKVVVKINEEEQAPEIKTASIGTAQMYKLGELYSAPIVAMNQNTATFVNNKTARIVMLDNNTPVITEKVIGIPKTAEVRDIPAPVYDPDPQPGGVYTIVGDKFATEPFVMRDMTTYTVTGVNENGQLVYVYKLASDKCDCEVERTKDKVIYILKGDWQFYKFGQISESKKEKLGDITINKIGNNYTVSYENKTQVYNKDGLERFLARQGISFQMIQHILSELEKTRIINISLYKDFARKSLSDNTSTITESVRLKLFKQASVLGTLAGDARMDKLHNAYTELLGLLEDIQRGNIQMDYQNVLECAQKLDNILKEYANIKYFKTNET